MVHHPQLPLFAPGADLDETAAGKKTLGRPPVQNPEAPPLQPEPYKSNDGNGDSDRHSFHGIPPSLSFS